MAVIGIALSVLGALIVHDYEKRLAEVIFTQKIQQISAEIEEQFTRPVYGLNGAKAAFHAAKGLDKGAFQRYFDARDLDHEFPGVLAFAWIERVTDSQLNKFVARVRQDDSPSFKVRPLDDQPYDTHYIVRHIEPLKDNMQALGLDVGSNADRSQPIDMAAESGLPQLSAPLQLVQIRRSSTGVVLNVPVYTTPQTPVTAEGRKFQFVGVMNAVAIPQELLARSSLLGSTDLDVAVQMTDVTNNAEDTKKVLLFSSHADKPTKPAHYSASRLNIYGRTFEISAQSTPTFEQVNTSQTPLLIFLLGFGFTSWLTVYARREKLKWLEETQTHQQRTEASSRMQSISKNLAHAVIFTDKQGLITWSNASFENLTGYKPSEVLGKKAAKLLRCEATNRLEAAKLDAAIAVKQSYVCELLQQNKDGRIIWLEIRTVPLFDDAGQHSGNLEFMSDVSAQNKQTLALEVLAMHNKSLIKGLDEIAMVSITDAQGVITHANDRFCEISGYGLDELIGHTHGRVNAGLDGVTDWSEVWRQIKRGETWHGEICNRRKSGDLYWFVCLIMPFKDAKGDIEKFVSIRFDITAAKQAMRELSDQKTLMYGAIEILGEGFCLFDPQDRLVYFNDKYVEIYDHSRSAIQLGATFEHIKRFGADHGQYSDALGRVDDWVAERVAAHKAADTAVIQTLADSRVLKILERRLPTGHTVGFRIDITDQMRAIETAEKANAIKGVFLANMSHEIRTPMNGVLGMLQLLSRTTLTSQQEVFTNHAMGAAKLLLGLLNDILDSSRMNAGQLELEHSAFCLDDVMRDLAMVMSANTSPKVEVLIDMDDAGAVNLVGDSLRLYQVLLNLCSNALKFTEHGHVMLRVSTRLVSHDERHVAFEVIDTGMGMNADFLEHIFSPFTQANASINRRFDGTGLGLNLSHNLVKLMGGTLNVDSTLGQGSRFYFDNRFQIDQAKKVSSANAETIRATSPVRVLVVKENDQARASMTDLGHQFGWQVTACTSGAEALSHLRQASKIGPVFDVVFMDCHMTECTGWQTVFALRQAKDDTPVVMLATRQCVTDALEQGIENTDWVDATLLKPVTASMLHDAWANLHIKRQGSAVVTSASPISGDVTSASLWGLDILLVEDNPINQQVGLGLLVGEGASVTIADNGQQAIDFLHANPTRFDVVLMDMQMPVLDGLSATRTIRHEMGLLDLPIIAMTANAMTTDREACLAAGMNDHVTKPLFVGDLVHAIVSQLKNR